MKLSIIGGGFMGEAIIDQVIARGLAAPDQVHVCELHANRRGYLAERYKVSTSAELNGNAPTDALVLAVKPQDFSSVAETLRRHLHPEQLVVSIMAGVRMDHIGDTLSRHHVVRVMPNLAAAVGESFSIWTAMEEVTQEQRAAVQQLLSSFGREMYTDEEKLLDIATAVSGSGPGYVMLLLEALIDGAVHVGLRRDVATEMVLQTVLGATRWVQASGRHPAELRGQVASAGGTTVEGLLALERRGVRAALVEAVIAGYEKSRALGG
ncbi:MAG: pyrroline-5-carboxylate reductase [Chloroflexi bacterium]|nr:pyrroline-5-carboxylate reductase [Chloroflexota bacterium]